MYRRPASKYKRPPYGQKKDDAPENLPLVIQTEEIPLPNEEDIPPLPLTDMTNEDAGLFRFLGKDFFLDDLILIGILIILIGEKVEDELLLIIIVYILLF